MLFQVTVTETRCEEVGHPWEEGITTMQESERSAEYSGHVAWGALPCDFTLMIDSSCGELPRRHVDGNRSAFLSGRLASAGIILSVPTWDLYGYTWADLRPGDQWSVIRKAARRGDVEEDSSEEESSEEFDMA